MHLLWANDMFLIYNYQALKPTSSNHGAAPAITPTNQLLRIWGGKSMIRTVCMFICVSYRWQFITKFWFSKHPNLYDFVIEWGKVRLTRPWNRELCFFLSVWVSVCLSLLLSPRSVKASATPSDTVTIAFLHFFLPAVLFIRTPVVSTIQSLISPAIIFFVFLFLLRLFFWA